MAEHLPHHSPGKSITRTVGATAVIGGMLVKISADNTVIPTTGPTDVYEGVAAQDGLTGAQIVVESGGEHALTAAAIIAAGGRIEARAAGQVGPWAGTNVQDIIGHCTKGSASGASTGLYRLYR